MRSSVLVAERQLEKLNQRLNLQYQNEQKKIELHLKL